MNRLLIGLLAARLASGAAAAATASDLARNTNSVAATAPDSKQAVETEYQNLLAEDDAAQEEVDRWIRDNEEFAAKGAAIGNLEMKQKIRQRFEPVRKAYEDFLKRHPDHARARVAYGSFLGDMNDEDGAQEQLEKALALETNNPAVYNNLANIYGHTGPVKKAFEFYARAIELKPDEPVYYHNFGTTVYLFRQDAREYYGITEQEVFDKALTLYSNAMRLDPDNFPLASDVAQTYYGIKPTRVEDALKAWTNALHIAHDEIEREGVYLHFARVKLHAGRFAEARAHLDAVTNVMYLQLKKRLERNLAEQQTSAASTNKLEATNAPAGSGPAK